MNYQKVFDWEANREYGFILQISGEPVSPENYYDPARYNTGYTDSDGEFRPAGCHGWFWDLISDGMSGPQFSLDPEARSAVYQYLQSHAPGVFDFEGDRLTLYDKSRYLSRRTFQPWRDILKKLATVSPDEYDAENATLLMNALNEYFDLDKKDGFYVDLGDGPTDFMTLGNFLRKIQPGDSFYVGAIIWYRVREEHANIYWVC